jgi:hypothetical protein
MTRPWIASAILAAGIVCGPAGAFAQPAPAPAPGAERLPRGEVLRLFDAYAVVQAQEALGLDHARYGVFVAGYKALLETRRHHRERRVRLVAELARLLRDGASPEEAHLRDRLKELQDHDALAAAEVAHALDALDQSLTVVERARFRVFEEQMEQRKLDLLARARAARQANRRGLRQ